MRDQIKNYLLWFFVFSLQVTLAQEKNISEFQPAHIIKGELENGMHYYIMHNEEPKDRVSFYFAQNVGSILEEDSQQGLAHFLEHMAFNGTQHYKDKQMLEYLEKNGIKFGAEINAFTSFDETVYNINKVPIENEKLLDSVLLVLHDWSGGLTLDDKEIDNERGVVKEEWRSRNTPQSRASDKIFKEGVLKGSKYERRFPIGIMDVVDNFDYQELRDYYKLWYRPDMQAVIVVGDIDPLKMEKKIKTIFSDIPLRKDLPERERFKTPIQKELVYITATDKELGEPVLQYYIKHKANNSISAKEEIEENLKLQLARYLLNNRLAEITRKSESPVLSAGFGISNFVRPLDILSMSAQPKKDSLLPAVEFVFTELKRFVLHGATAAELTRAKAAFKTSLEAALKNKDKRTSDAYAGEIYSAFFQEREISDYEWKLKYSLSLLDKISNKDLLEILQKYDASEGNIVAFTGSDSFEYPKKEAIIALRENIKKKNPKAYEEEISDKKLINKSLSGAKIVSTKAVDGIDAKTYTLSNGARVTLYPTDYDKEQVSFQAYSPGGKSLLQQEFLSNALVATALASESGLGTMSKVELSKFLQGKQTSLSVQIGDYSESLSGKSTLNDVETLFKRIYLTFTSPRFEENALSLIEQSLENSLTAKENNVKSDFSDSLQLALSNYSQREILFNQKLIDELSLEKMEVIYKDRITNAGDFDFIFVGDFEEENLLEFVKKYIGSIPGKSEQEKAENHDIKPAPGTTKVHLSRKMKTPQTTVSITLTGDMKYNKEHNLIMNMVGQLLSKRYLDKIREEEGGSYGVSAVGNMENIPEDNYVLRINFNCNPDKTARLVEIVFEDIKNLSHEIDSAELLEIKKNLKKGVVENRENNLYWMQKISSSIKNGIPISSEEEVLELIDGITEKQIKAMAAEINKDPRVVEGVLTPITK